MYYYYIKDLLLFNVRLCTLWKKTKKNLKKLAYILSVVFSNRPKILGFSVFLILLPLFFKKTNLPTFWQNNMFTIFCLHGQLFIYKMSLGLLVVTSLAIILVLYLGIKYNQKKYHVLLLNVCTRIIIKNIMKKLLRKK